MDSPHCTRTVDSRKRRLPIGNVIWICHCKDLHATSSSIHTEPQVRGKVATEGIAGRKLRQKDYSSGRWTNGYATKHPKVEKNNDARSTTTQGRTQSSARSERASARLDESNSVGPVSLGRDWGRYGRFSCRRWCRGAGCQSGPHRTQFDGGRLPEHGLRTFKGAY